MRLGWIVEAVSEATITGLKFAVALTIIADQLPKLLAPSAADAGFGPDVRHAATHLDEASAGEAPASRASNEPAP